ncbi:MAG: PaaX domain-containing protein, C- domain protein [Ilumatobacteraceae bacterium]
MASKSRNAPNPAAADAPPLTTRSIVLSLLLGSHPPALPVASLVEFCGLFGIANGTVRTTLSRMVDRGELAVDGAVYRLSGRLLDRQAEQDLGRARRTVGWNDDWWIVIVTAERRPVAERRAFRSRAAGAKLGELRADLWMRPANVQIPTDLAGVVISRGPLVDADDALVARSLWDLEAIDARSRSLTDQLDGAGRDLVGAGPSGLPTAFETLARALRHLRVEPQLPERLHPPAAGDALRERYRSVERAFRDELQAFLRHR